VRLGGGYGGGDPHGVVAQIWLDIQISSYISVDEGTTGIGQYLYTLFVVVLRNSYSLHTSDKYEFSVVILTILEYVFAVFTIYEL
jgi:hypothetical protein